MPKHNHDHDHDHDIAEVPERGGDEDSDLIWVTEFTEDSARDFVEKVLKASKKDAKQPIVVYVDSYGGSIAALTAMLAALDHVPNKIVTVCVGKAMSAGAVLLSHGDIRYVTPRARVMVHEAAGGAIGNINDAKVDIRELETLNRLMLELLAENCGKPLSAIQKLFTNKRRDVYLDAEAAVKLGIADRIGFPKLKKIVRYEVE